MCWWGTWPTEGLMFTPLSSELNDILCISVLIANQFLSSSLSFQSTFPNQWQNYYFFCMWHLFIGCARKKIASGFWVVTINRSFSNNSIFYQLLCINRACIRYFMYSILFEPCFCDVECRICCSVAPAYMPCHTFLPLYALVFLFSDFPFPLRCSPPCSLRGRCSVCFLHCALQA